MDIAIMLEGQEGPTYDTILGVARRVQHHGLQGLYRSDHYSSIGGAAERPATDAWATLAGLARETQDIHIGTLVSPVTFRPPAVVAKTAATVSEMAGSTPEGGSRVTLGMGTGWYEPEHRRHGFPFEDLPTRFRRLEEHLQVVTRLYDADAQPFDFDGEFASLRDAMLAPVPSPRPRIAVGGSGMRRTPALAGRYADELNGVFLRPAQCREQRGALARACDDAGRDPAAVRYSLMTGCLVAETATELHARVRRLQEHEGDGRPVGEVLREREATWVQGTPDQALERLDELSDAGVECVMLQDLLPDDLEMVDLIAERLRG